jgi:beta-galactosidase
MESFPNQALENWNMVEKQPFVIGDFVWTAWDYLGEAGLGQAKIDNADKQRFSFSTDWPWYNAWCGDIDITGEKKPQSYYRDVVWRRSPIAMAVHSPIPAGMKEQISDWGWPDEFQSWTWPGLRGKVLQVRIFSRAKMVRLRLNDKLIGEQIIPDTAITATFQVPYQPGVLKAVNLVNGKERDAIVFKTSGMPSRIRLVADRRLINADRNDLSYVKVEVTDKNGNVIPYGETTIHFSISEKGEIAGVSNANPKEMASFRQPERKTWRGKCLVIVRPKRQKGNIILKATADGLSSSSIVISAK